MTQATVTPEQYLTVGEIAEDLRLARMTVYRLIHAGEFPAIRIGARTFRVPARTYYDYKARLHAEADQHATRTATPIPGQTSIPA